MGDEVTPTVTHETQGSINRLAPAEVQRRLNFAQNNLPEISALRPDFPYTFIMQNLPAMASANSTGEFGPKTALFLDQVDQLQQKWQIVENRNGPARTPEELQQRRQFLRQQAERLAREASEQRIGAIQPVNISAIQEIPSQHANDRSSINEWAVAQRRALNGSAPDIHAINKINTLEANGYRALEGRDSYQAAVATENRLRADYDARRPATDMLLLQGANIGETPAATPLPVDEPAPPSVPTPAAPSAEPVAPVPPAEPRMPEESTEVLDNTPISKKRARELLNEAKSILARDPSERSKLIIEGVLLRMKGMGQVKASENASADGSHKGLNYDVPNLHLLEKALADNDFSAIRDALEVMIPTQEDLERNAEWMKAQKQIAKALDESVSRLTMYDDVGNEHGKYYRGANSGYSTDVTFKASRVNDNLPYLDYTQDDLLTREMTPGKDAVLAFLVERGILGRISHQRRGESLLDLVFDGYNYPYYIMSALMDNTQERKAVEGKKPATGEMVSTGDIRLVAAAYDQSAFEQDKIVRHTRHDYQRGLDKIGYFFSKRRREKTREKRNVRRVSRILKRKGNHYRFIANGIRIPKELRYVDRLSRTNEKYIERQRQLGKEIAVVQRTDTRYKF